jgi:hypothetical protein
MSGPTDKTDIVDRLRKRMVRRKLGDDPLVKVFGDAADEIERLREALEWIAEDGAPGERATECARAALNPPKGERT